MTELLQELIAFLREASPFVWETMVRQVYVDAVRFTIFAVFMIIGVIFGVWMFRMFWFCDEKAEGDDGIAISGLFIALMCSVIDVAFLYEVAARLINPDYYAIKLILGQLGG